MATLDDFKESFKLLPACADFDNSSTLDFTARQRKATADVRPFHKTETDKKAEVDTLKAMLGDLKKAKPPRRADFSLSRTD